MCAWAETRGALIAVLSEHHGACDGHLPAPHILASAIAARTKQLAILWPLCRSRSGIRSGWPRRSASWTSSARGGSRTPSESATALRNTSISGSTWTGAAGWPTSRSHCCGRCLRGNPSSSTAGVFMSHRLLRRPEGRTCSSREAARPRRGARRSTGWGSSPKPIHPALKDFYEAECRANGHEPGVIQFPAPDAPTTVFVADDVDAAWDELGPHLLHDAMTAASYRHGDDSVASISRADTVAALREITGPYRIFTIDEAAAYIRAADRFRCFRCAAASRPTSRGHIWNAPSWRPSVRDRKERTVTLRTVVWSTGGVGSIAIDAITGRPDLELVGVWVHSADKVGQDAGELAGIDPIGVTATNDADALIALRPDCVVYAASGPDRDAGAVPDYLQAARLGHQRGVDVVDQPGVSARLFLARVARADGNGGQGGKCVVLRIRHLSRLRLGSAGAAARHAVEEDRLPQGHRGRTQRPLPGGRRDDERHGLRPSARLRTDA